MFAKFELRRLDLPAARKILGASIGMCPKEALFKGYIQLEIDVSSTGNLNRSPFQMLTPHSCGNSTVLGSYMKSISK